MECEKNDNCPSNSITTFAATMAVIFTIIGVTGNLLTIAGLYRIPKLRQKATTKFVISLALSDFLFSAINTPMNAALYIQKKSFQIGMFSEIINLCTNKYIQGVS